MHFQEDMGCCAQHSAALQTGRALSGIRCGSQSVLPEGWGDEEQEWSGLGTTVRRALQQSQFILELHIS